MRVQKKNLFGVLRRVVPSHGVKVGCRTELIQQALFRREADELADALQAQNPSEEYAVFEVVYRRFTKPGV